MSNPWCFGALSVGSVPTPSPLRVDEGGFSRRYTVFLPSVAFAFVFSRLPPLVELLASGVGLDGCVGCRDRLSLLQLSLFVFFFLSLATGSFRGLVVVLVTGSMAVLVLGIPWLWKFTPIM